jgi:hypothetical protein
VVALLFVAVLAIVLIWSLAASPRRLRARRTREVLSSAPDHLRSISAMRQAFDDADARYVQEAAGKPAARQLKTERRRVALLYLEAIRADFQQLLRIASVVALLSPTVSGSHEYERMRLSVVFALRFHVLKARIWMGGLVIPQMGFLGQMVATLALQMETSMAELGERAALAADLAMQSER